MIKHSSKIFKRCEDETHLFNRLCSLITIITSGLRAWTCQLKITHIPSHYPRCIVYHNTKQQLKTVHYNNAPYACKKDLLPHAPQTQTKPSKEIICPLIIHTPIHLHTKNNQFYDFSTTVVGKVDVCGLQLFELCMIVINCYYWY